MRNRGSFAKVFYALLSSPDHESSASHAREITGRKLPASSHKGRRAQAAGIKDAANFTGDAVSICTGLLTLLLFRHGAKSSTAQGERLAASSN